MRLLKILWIGIFVTLGGCTPFSFFSSGIATLDTTSQERGLGGYVTDSEIQARLNVLYFEHNHVLHYRINVTVYEGRILLTGVLPTQEMQEEAIRIAWQVPGVKTVIDETMVGEKRTLGQYASDKFLMNSINTKLFLDSKIRSRNYEVVAVKGVVYIVGLAFNEEELQKVLEICRTTKGVEKVISYVRLMNLHERRRRYLFNKRKHPTPLEKNKKEKEMALNPTKVTGSWEQAPVDKSVYETDIKKKHE